MKAYKIELLVVDYDELGEEEIRQIVEDIGQVKKITTSEIGEWSDEHPLNQNSTADAEYRRLFG